MGSSKSLVSMFTRKKNSYISLPSFFTFALEALVKVACLVCCIILLVTKGIQKKTVRNGFSDTRKREERKRK